MNKLEFAVISYDQKYESQMHSHDYVEIVYYLEGSATLFFNNETIDIQAGGIVYIPSGTPHREVSQQGFKYIAIFVIFMRDFGKEIFVLNDKYNQEYKQILLQIVNNNHLRASNWENIEDALLSVLMEYMSSWGTSIQKNSHVEICERIIIENISNCAFSLNALLDSIPMSKTYFMKLFKNEIGLTPNNFLLEKRMNYAKRLLLSNDSHKLRIRDISLMCGYRDVYHFSTMFKKATGYSPKHWMQKTQQST